MAEVMAPMSSVNLQDTACVARHGDGHRELRQDRDGFAGDRRCALVPDFMRRIRADQ